MTDIDQAPPPLQLGEQVFDLDFHPVHDILATGTISGKVQLHKFESGKWCRALQPPGHSKACRSLQFTPDGNGLVTVSSDQSLQLIDQVGAVAWQQKDAHCAGLNCVRLFDSLMPNIVTGDEDGGVKFWDLRQQKCVKEFKENNDFISDFAINPNGTHVLATSGDGRLSVFDCRTGVLEGRSDEQDDELLSVHVMKNGRKVICGSQEGVLMIWSWGTWGDISDRFPGHPNSIDSMLKIDEDTLCTGSSDGIIRVVSVQPNKLLGLIGDHDDFPVERMKWSRDRNLIGSISHSDDVRFWDVSYLHEEDEDQEGLEKEEATTDKMEDSDSEEERDSKKNKKKTKKAKKADLKAKTVKTREDDFFADM